ncbi:hypothetical protein ACFY4C_29610 [Actinomadura viridis]|uniref:hypothetical protein n=1 Tax=Actinomadura viridis TaxID=58110 RepID=UPI00369F332D
MPSSLNGRPCVRPAALALAALTTAGTLTACGDEPGSGAFKPNGSLSTTSPGTGGPGTTAAPAPSALPTAQVNQTVLERYREYRKIFKRAYERNDPSELSTVTMDPLLNETTRDIEQLKAKGQIWRFTTVSNAKVYARSKDGLTVYVIDCIRTLAGYRFSLKTGKRTGGGTGGSYLHRIAVRYDQGTWKVTDSVQDKKC